MSTLIFLMELSPWEIEVADIIAKGGKCSQNYIKKISGYAPDDALDHFLEACEINELIWRDPYDTTCFYCLKKAKTNIILAQYGRRLLKKYHKIKP